MRPRRPNHFPSSCRAYRRGYVARPISIHLLALTILRWNLNPVPTYSIAGQRRFLAFGHVRQQILGRHPTRATNQFRSSAPKARPPGHRCGCSCLIEPSADGWTPFFSAVAIPFLKPQPLGRPWSCRHWLPGAPLAVHHFHAPVLSAQFPDELCLKSQPWEKRRERKGEESWNGGWEAGRAEAPGLEAPSSSAWPVDRVESPWRPLIGSRRRGDRARAERSAPRRVARESARR